MDPAYDGREQTAAKHYILRHYLQRLAYKVLQGRAVALTYIDGFSGPWNARSQDYADTSFMIAITVLKQVQTHLLELGHEVEIRCLFIEEKRRSFEKLTSIVSAHNDPNASFRIATFHGSFEDAVPEAVTFAANSFALTFIDPTGWTGFGLDKCAPLLLHHPGEVLVNYMYDHISRFSGWDEQRNEASFDAILGGKGWKDRLEPFIPTGEAVERLFCRSFKAAGRFRHVISTKIDKITDRPHFAIAYGTRAAAGLRVFRDVEQAALLEHAVRRSQARLSREKAKSGQGFLFSADAIATPTFESLLASQRSEATAWVRDLINQMPRQRFSQLSEAVLPLYMVRDIDVKDICVQLARDGVIKNTWVGDGKKKPFDEHMIERI